MLRIILEYLIFPGFAFCFAAGSLGWWLERKLTARFQYRVGPPWYQNFIDVAKLFLKETLIPQNAAKAVFVLSPLMTFSAVMLFSLMVAQSFFLDKTFIGDSLVMLYLLIMPSLFIILGAFASANPLASVGATRETKLMLAYEVVFIASLVIAIIKSGQSLTLGGILSAQAQNGMHLKNASGAIGLILALCYLQAKLGIAPFDVAEADQEIMSGIAIEYCGPLLGFFKLSKLLLYFSLPLFIIALFGQMAFASPLHKYAVLILEYAIIILLVAVIKNINPRLRIKEVLTFFWFFLFPVGIIGVILAIKGF